MNKCSKCQKYFDDLNLIKYSKTKRADGGYSQYYQCNPCNTKRMKNYRKTKKGKANAFNAVYRSIKKFPERHNARTLLNYHLRKGHLVKPKTCSRCGLEKKIEGHHPDHSKPLEVVWVCRTCHRIIENSSNK